MTLVEQYQRMVYKYANRVQRKHGGLLSLVDLEAAGMRGLCEAANTFNPTSGASIKTWIFMHARRHIQDEVRAQRKAMSEHTDTLMPEDNEDMGLDNVVNAMPSEDNVEDSVNREQVRDLLMAQIRRLPQKQQRLMIKMLAQGMTQAEYAQSEGVSPASVSFLYTDAVNRLRGLLSRFRGELSEA
jgi:RNA polymerase sigma factor (sigma-70 family)